MSETSSGIWKRTAPPAPSLPYMRSLNQDDKANSDMHCWDLFPHWFQAFSSTSPPRAQSGRPGCGQPTELDARDAGKWSNTSNGEVLEGPG